MRKAFSLLEAMLSILILSLVLTAGLRFYMVQRTFSMVKDQERKMSEVGKAFQQVYLTVTSTVAPICAPDGWASAYCDHTIPFPQFSSNGDVKIYLDADLPTATIDYLADTLKPVMAQVGCVYSGKKPEGESVALDYICARPLITGITYVLNDGTQTSGLPFGGIDPQHFPLSVKVDYTIDYGNKNTNAESKTLSMEELYQSLKDASAKRMADLKNALRVYALTRLEQEVNENPYPNGLHSTEDFYVPWVWQVLATDGNIYKQCGDYLCSGIDDWNTSDVSFDTVLTDVIERLFSKSTVYPECYDGFMYRWRIILIGNGCSGDLSACTAYNAKPPSPNKNVAPGDYYSKYAVKPPYFSWIVSSAPSCLQNDSSPEFCRSRVVYDR